MNKTAIEKEVKSILENYDLNTTAFKSNTSFINNLGLDSIDFVVLILKVEDVFGICISFNNDNIDTIGDLVNTIEYKMKKDKE